MVELVNWLSSLLSRIDTVSATAIARNLAIEGRFQDCMKLSATLPYKDAPLYTVVLSSARNVDEIHQVWSDILQ